MLQFILTSAIQSCHAGLEARDQIKTAQRERQKYRQRVLLYYGTRKLKSQRVFKTEFSAAVNGKTTKTALPIRGGKREVGINIQRATCQISNGGIFLFLVARLLFIRIKVDAADDAKADDRPE